MLNTVLFGVSIILGIALILSGWRLLIGPSTTDRILALDTLYINSIALIVMLGLYFRSTLYFVARSSFFRWPITRF